MVIRIINVNTRLCKKIDCETTELDPHSLNVITAFYDAHKDYEVERLW